MKNPNLLRERMAWTAVVVALATSASWLAAIDLTLLIRQSGAVPPEALVALRALARVAWLLIRQAVPVALIAAFVSGVILLAWTERNEAQVKERARHA
jgi:hypothetical protein